ncbi:MAG: serine/threonine protein kinase, partial [Pirellulaceae bacterium]|nr:serine/threonine protein kinase [Pirellulaceae bacterium]
MSQAATCPRCQSPLAADAPEGLCAACLMAGGLASAPSPASGSAATTPWTDEKRAAVIADLAPHFPQLEIIELLGQGGMGAVYKARQKHLDRFVALKVIPPEAAKDPAFAERFSREARALARLNHPNIVTVHDFGQSDGGYFLLMEFVDGLNLRQTMRSGKLSPQEALVIVPHICEALQYAHDQGIVHRDVKPENVLLDKWGRVKIADFGLAKLLTHSPQDYTLTHSMQVMGTPRYMAPEQFDHPTEVDHRADIYSLGVMFYEMLTGEIPMGRFAPPSQKVRIDIRIDEIVLRSLEKEPARRYQQASDVKTELETVASSPRTASTAAASSVSHDDDIDEVRVQIVWPGMGLTMGGVLGLLFSLYLLAVALLAMSMPSRGGPEDYWPIVYLVMVAIDLPWAMLVMFAGIKIMRLESYWLSLVGTCFALLPISPASLLTIPMALWGLSILTSRQARDAYRRKELLDAPGGDTRSPILQVASNPTPRLPTSEQEKKGAEPPTESFVRVATKPANPMADATRNAARVEMQGPGFGLYWPGMGLQVAGIIGILPLVYVLGEMVFLLWMNVVDGTDYPVWTRQRRFFFDDTDLGTICFAMLAQVPSSILLLISGRAIRQITHYRLALIGSIVALIPCGPTWLISLPLGIWAVVVLLTPEV